MEARMGTAGRREFVQVLRLMEDFHQHHVEGAVSEAVGMSLNPRMRYCCSAVSINHAKTVLGLSQISS
jgi:hypothetical protein